MVFFYYIFLLLFFSSTHAAVLHSIFRFVLFVKNRRLKVANTPPWVLPLCVQQWERQGDAGGGRWGRGWEGQFVRWFDLDSFTGPISFCSRVLAELH